MISNSIGQGRAQITDFSSALEIKLESNLEDVILASDEMKWVPSTNKVIRITELIGLPTYFSQSGNQDIRPGSEIVSPFIQLNDLLPFQMKVKNDIIQTLEANSRGIVVMPTGAGKTRTTVEAIIQYLNSNTKPISKVIWLADRDELCEQAFQTFKEIIVNRASHPVTLWRFWKGNDLKFLSEETQSIEGIVVTSIQQLRNRFEKHDPMAINLLNSCEIVVIDEAHRNIDWNHSLITYLNIS